MTIKEATDFIRMKYGFHCIYYPGPMQLKVFIDPINFFIYEGEDLFKYDFDDLANIIDDDLFSYENKRRLENERP